MSGSCWAIVLATGRDQEFSTGAETAFLGVGNRPSLACVLCAIENCRRIEGAVVAMARDKLEMMGPMRFRFGIGKVRASIAGVSRRTANLIRAMESVDDGAGWIVVMEACRPLVTPDMITQVLEAAERPGAAVIAQSIGDPIRMERRKGDHEAVRGGGLWSVQSPMVFRSDIFRRMLDAAQKAKEDVCDLIDLALGAGARVRMVSAPGANPALRTVDDLAIAAHLAGEKRV